MMLSRQYVSSTRIKKLQPRKGYLAPYIQFPWGYRTDLIGREIEIHEVKGGFFLKFVGEPGLEEPENRIIFRIKALETNVEQLLALHHQRWIHPEETEKCGC